MNIGDLTITSLDTITAFDVASGAYKFTLDELQDATISQTEEKTDITGKGGRKLNSLKKNKSVTVSGNNGLISGGLLETQVGGTFEKKDIEVQWVDYLTVEIKDGLPYVTTSYVAYGTYGNEIQSVYVKNSDGTIKKVLTDQTSVALNTGEFSYNNSNKKISFFSGSLNLDNEIEDSDLPPDFFGGEEIVVYYKRKINAETLSNESDKYSGKATLYIDAIAEDKCANIYHIQFYIPKADFNGEFSFEMGNDQSVHAFEAEALAGACGVGGTLWTYTIFQDDVADVTA